MTHFPIINSFGPEIQQILVLCMYSTHDFDLSLQLISTSDGHIYRVITRPRSPAVSAIITVVSHMHEDRNEHKCNISVWMCLKAFFLALPPPFKKLETMINYPITLRDSLTLLMTSETVTILNVLLDN